MKKRIAFLLLVVVGLAVGGGIYWNRHVLRAASSSGLRVSGNIEVTDVEVSFRTPGWVEARLVSEGDFVEAGAPVARLDRREFDHEAAMRRAELAAAEARLSELEAGSRPEELDQAEAAVKKMGAMVEELENGSRAQEILAARAGVDAARAEVARTEIDFNRYQKLLDDRAVPKRQFEQVRSAYEVAKARLGEAEERLSLIEEGPRVENIEQGKAALAEAEARLELARNGARKEVFDQVRAEVERAKQALALSETRMGYAEIHAPVSGIVLAEHVEAGEYVTPGTPVVTIGDLENVWLRAFVNETDLGSVKPGQTVSVYTDTFPGKAYVGRISFIASEAEFTPKSIQTEQERVKLVYRIKVDVENPGLELKPGMPADAVIDTGGEAHP